MIVKWDWLLLERMSKYNKDVIFGVKQVLLLFDSTFHTIWHITIYRARSQFLWTITQADKCNLGTYYKILVSGIDVAGYSLKHGEAHQFIIYNYSWKEIIWSFVLSPCLLPYQEPGPPFTPPHLLNRNYLGCWFCPHFWLGLLCK